MGLIENKINTILTEKNLSLSNTARIINEHESSFISMVKGKRDFTEKTLFELLKIINVSQEEFTSWAIHDNYPKNLVQLAYENKKNFPYKRKSVFTTKIDECLKTKNLSRTQLSKEIKYNQSALNQIITGKRSLSASVIHKIAIFLELSPDEILSWKIADSYDLAILEKTLLLYVN